MQTLKKDLLENIKSQHNKIDPRIAKRWNNIKKFCNKNKLMIVNSDKSKKNLILSSINYNRMGENFITKSNDYVQIVKSNAPTFPKKPTISWSFYVMATVSSNHATTRNYHLPKHNLPGCSS